jgi:hypothetical protein
MSEEIDRLVRLFSRAPKHPRITLADVEPGQIWSTNEFSGFPDGLPQDARTDDPLWVVILKPVAGRANGHRFFYAAPIFPEIEFAGPDDVLLASTVLGFPCAVATKGALTILEDSLRQCEGETSSAEFVRLKQFAESSSRDEKLFASISVGLAYLGPNDPRIQFHEELDARLDYLWEPVASAIETMSLEFEPAREPLSQKLKESVAEILEAVRTGVRQLASVEWLATFERQLQPVGMQASEERRERHEQKYLAPSENLTITVTAQATRGPDVRFQVFDQAGERSSAIDGAIVIGADGNPSAPITGGQTRMNPQQLERGFVIVKPHGGILDLEPEQ